MVFTPANSGLCADLTACTASRQAAFMPTKTFHVRQHPVWFITGCSTGLGRTLAQRVIASSARLGVKARDVSSVLDLVAGHGGRAIAVARDINDAAQITAAVKMAEHTLGRIDILVTNAGYDCPATVKEAQAAISARSSTPTCSACSP
jgi:NADP-dependent 3-hydroxy acid dehydrogenase YdfG